MRKLNKVTTVKNDTIETYSHCSYNCQCQYKYCGCTKYTSAQQTTSANLNDYTHDTTFDNSYRK